MSTVLSAAGCREVQALGPRPASVLPGRDVPAFGVILVGRSRIRHRLRAALRRRRAPLLATAALCAALAAALAWAAGLPRGGPTASHAASARPAASAPPVLAPVRIADPATVRLLRPGDRVDVLAAGADDGPARTVARHVRVQQVPSAHGPRPDSALVVLKVPRTTATRLAGAAAHARLSVTMWSTSRP